MMGAGVFECYPRLRVSFGESGAGWFGLLILPSKRVSSRQFEVYGHAFLARKRGQSTTDLIWIKQLQIRSRYRRSLRNGSAR